MSLIEKRCVGACIYRNAGLVIAAMLKAGWFANTGALTHPNKDTKWWIEQADELIAASREAK